MPTILLTAVISALSPTPPAPPTEKHPVTDTYHGVTVTDDYRHLEDWSAAPVKAWSESQNTYARSVLDALPNVDAIRKRVTEIMSAQSESYSGIEQKRGTLFAIKRQPPKQQPFLVVLEGGIDKPESARVLVDPNAMDSTGHTAIDWYHPSPDGKLVAVSISQGGSESGDVHIFDVKTGKDTGELVPRVNGGTAGGSLAWNKDGTGFFYSRYPRDTDRPAADMDFYTHVYFHKIGTPTKADMHELGDGKEQPAVPGTTLGRRNAFEFTRIAEIMLASDENSGKVLCTVQHGDGGTFAFYLRDEKGDWKLIADYDDKVVQAAFGPNGSLYLISRNGAPKGKILHIEYDQVSSGIKAAKELIPEGKDTIVSEFTGPEVLTSTPKSLILTYQLGGPAELRFFDHSGKSAPAPTQLPVGSVGGVALLDGGKILFNNVSYLQPSAWYEFDPAAAKPTTRKTALAVKAPVNFDDCEIIREFATSKDGTKIPVNIIRKKGTKLDGANPCVVTAYGGYGVNIDPAFRAGTRVLIDHGFIWAEANIRGGGEYGETWHRQGALVHKQNVFDDFAAACKHMIDKKYTNPEKLAIEGGSNGGLLMGATVAQHSEMIKAVVSHVGIYDMLRVELSSNGAFNIPEFGTVKDEAQFKALYAYSPYHRVKEGVKYPAVLFLTGANDPRVDPMQSRKMTARLQAVGADVLLRTSSNSGHGMGSSLNERIEQAVDIDAWLFHKLDVQ